MALECGRDGGHRQRNLIAGYASLFHSRINAVEHWYLVQTKPLCERSVAVQWHQRGIEVYLPLMWVNPVNRRAARERPYFPGYLFARLDLESVSADLVRWSPGVKGLVEFNEKPAPLSDDFMSELQQRLGRVRAVGTLSNGGVGEAEFLGMRQTPFEGFEGIFNPRLLGGDRARILLASVEHEHFRTTLNSRQAGRPTSRRARK